MSRHHRSRDRTAVGSFWRTIMSGYSDSGCCVKFKDPSMLTAEGSSRSRTKMPPARGWPRPFQLKFCGRSVRSEGPDNASFVMLRSRNRRSRVQGEQRGSLVKMWVDVSGSRLRGLYTTFSDSDVSMRLMITDVFAGRWQI